MTDNNTGRWVSSDDIIVRISVHCRTLENIREVRRKLVEIYPRCDVKWREAAAPNQVAWNTYHQHTVLMIINRRNHMGDLLYYGTLGQNEIGIEAEDFLLEKATVDLKGICVGADHG